MRSKKIRPEADFKGRRSKTKLKLRLLLARHHCRFGGGSRGSYGFDFFFHLAVGLGRGFGFDLGFLFLAAAEHREVDVALGIGFEVGEQGVGAGRRGVEVRVERIVVDELTQERNRVQVAVELGKDVVVGDSTVASLSGSLLGSKTITLFLGKNSKVFEGGEELKSYTVASITDAFQAKALPVLGTVDSTLIKVNSFLSKEAKVSLQATLQTT